MNRRIRKSRSEESFDPNQHNGKHRWTDRLLDVGYFVKAQGSEARAMLLRTWRLGCELVSEVRKGRRK
ncbi:MAG: hypothetical protein NXI32_07390 [bacterium]|nr:hypothetical protein [bacterium]